MSDEPRCWGCSREPAIDGTLGEACRRQLLVRRTDPSTPALNEHIGKLDDIYTRLCWNCAVELSQAISGLCGVCEHTIRR